MLYLSLKNLCSSVKTSTGRNFCHLLQSFLNFCSRRMEKIAFEALLRWAGVVLVHCAAALQHCVAFAIPPNVVDFLSPAACFPAGVVAFQRAVFAFPLSVDFPENAACFRVGVVAFQPDVAVAFDHYVALLLRLFGVAFQCYAALHQLSVGFPWPSASHRPALTLHGYG